MSEKNYVMNGAPHGNVAQQLMSGVSLSEYRTFASLPKRAWELIDATIERVAKANMPGIADLNRAPGVAINFDGMTGSTYTMYRASEMSQAHMAMSPDTRGQADILDFDSISVPLPVTVKDFWVNTKQVAMAADKGIALTTYATEEASYQVSTEVERNLFKGNYTAAGSTLYGYTTFPDRQTYKLAKSWNPASVTPATPEEILTDVLNMVNKSMYANHYGPWVLYIPWEYAIRMGEDYTTGTNETPLNVTIQERLLRIPGLQAVTISRNLVGSGEVGPPPEEVVLVEMTPRTVKLLNGITMTAVDWEPPGSPNWNHNFKIITMMVPMLISDYEGQCGIVHGYRQV